MSAIQANVEAASASYAAAFTKSHLALPPAKKYLVLTCMDARIDPAQAFGIELGDAHVIRNVRHQLTLYLFSVSPHPSATRFKLPRPFHSWFVD
jgi:carbonic anhydrase